MRYDLIATAKHTYCTTTNDNSYRYYLPKNKRSVNKKSEIGIFY